MSISRSERVHGLRGATTVARNDAATILEATGELLTAMLETNRLAASDIVSIVFTATQDLDATFPAGAARTVGLGEVPVLSATELDVPGALGRCVRILMHVYPPEGTSELRSVYLHGATSLRADLDP